MTLMNTLHNYFSYVGAKLASIALLIMPNSPCLWIAAGRKSKRVL